jgi:hypothetical protein
VGEKMGGVTVSAKAEGQTITTGVFTDEAATVAQISGNPAEFWPHETIRV